MHVRGTLYATYDHTIVTLYAHVYTTFYVSVKKKKKKKRKKKNAVWNV